MECSRWAAPGLRGLPVSHQEVTCRLRARLGECCRQTGRSFGDEPPDCSCSSSIRPWWWYDLKRLGILKIFFGRRGRGGGKKMWLLTNCLTRSWRTNLHFSQESHYIYYAWGNNIKETGLLSAAHFQRPKGRFYECWCLNVSPSRHLKYQVCLINNNRALVIV